LRTKDDSDSLQGELRNMLNNLRALRNKIIHEHRKAQERHNQKGAKKLPGEIAHPLFEVYTQMKERLNLLERNIQINLATRDQLMDLLMNRGITEQQRQMTRARFVGVSLLEIYLAKQRGNVSSAQRMCEESIKLVPDDAILQDWQRRLSHGEELVIEAGGEAAAVMSEAGVSASPGDCCLM